MFYKCTDELPVTEVGSKAIRLAEMLRSGLNVPPFFVIPAAQCSQLQISPVPKAEFLKLLECHLLNYPNTTHFAIRSAALIEDSRHIAQAGVFMSVLPVAKADIFTAIDSVLADAREKKVSDMSIIIQVYVNPQHAGVVFTRNPICGAELIIESVQGEGSKAVGGQSVSRHIVAGHDDYIKLSQWQQELVTVAKKIEIQFNFPQDIEWAYAAGNVYILQARPITTISEQSFLAYKQITPTFKSPYYFVLASQAEAFLKPSPLMFSLLQALYENNGAIERAYVEAKISYRDTKQFSVLGGKLFIDKEAELQSLYPAYSYFKSTAGRPRVKSVSGLLSSIKNSLRHHQLGSVDMYTILEKKLKGRLSTIFPLQKNIEEMLQLIQQEYSFIYSINLHTTAILRKLQQLHPKAYAKVVASLVPQKPYRDAFLECGISDIHIGTTTGSFRSGNHVPCCRKRSRW